MTTCYLTSEQNKQVNPRNTGETALVHRLQLENHHREYLEHGETWKITAKQPLLEFRWSVHCVPSDLHTNQGKGRNAFEHCIIKKPRVKSFVSLTSTVGMYEWYSPHLRNEQLGVKHFCTSSYKNMKSFHSLKLFIRQMSACGQMT